LDKVAGEFEGEVLADLQGGRDQALALIESSRRDAMEEVSRILLGGTKQAESLKRQLVGTAELEVRNARLKAEEEAVNQAISAALDGLRSAQPQRYESSITSLIQEGLDVIGGKAVVACSQRDRETVLSALKKLGKGDAKLTLQAEPVDTIGGVVLSSSDGSVRFDNTFEARLERMKPILRKDVAALLERP
jgi:V/A-type H+-transporting ATPase subunit E